MPSMADYQKQIDEALRLAEAATRLLQQTGGSIKPEHVKIARQMVARFEILQRLITDFSQRAARVGVDDFTASVDGTMDKIGDFLEKHPSVIARSWAEAGGEMAAVEQWATRSEPALVFVEGIPAQIAVIEEKLKELEALTEGVEKESRQIAVELKWSTLHEGLKADGPTLITNADALKGDVAAVLADLDLSIAYSREKLAGVLKGELLGKLGISGPPPSDKEAAAKRARLEAWAADFAGGIAITPEKKKLKRSMAAAVKKIQWLEEQASDGAMLLNVQQASWRADGDWAPLLKSIGSTGVCLALTLEWLGGGGNPDELEDGGLSQQVQVSQQAGRIQRAFENSRHPNILEAERKRLAAETLIALQGVRDAVAADKAPLGTPPPSLDSLELAVTTLEEELEEHTVEVEELEDRIELEKDAHMDLEGERYDLEAEHDELKEELSELERAETPDLEAIRLKGLDVAGKQQEIDDKQQEVDDKQQEIVLAEERLEVLRASTLSAQLEAAQVKVAMWKAMDDVEAMLLPISEAIADADTAATEHIASAVGALQTGTVESIKEGKDFETKAMGQLSEIVSGHRQLAALAATLQKLPVPVEAESGPRDELPGPFLKAMKINVAKRPTIEETTLFTRDTFVEEFNRRCRGVIEAVESGTAASWHISLKGGSGHALGLRLREDDGVEFLDANAGGYSFSGIDAFEKWVPGWWDAFGLSTMSSVAISKVT